jgi:hypothetical protein
VGHKEDSWSGTLICGGRAKGSGDPLAKGKCDASDARPAKRCHMLLIFC